MANSFSTFRPSSRSRASFVLSVREKPLLDQETKLLMAEGQGGKEKRNNMYCWHCEEGKVKVQHND